MSTRLPIGILLLRLVLIALLVTLLMILSACSTQRLTAPTARSPVAPPAECLQLCPLIPKPLTNREEDMFIWQLEMIHWAEFCSLVNYDCFQALTND